MEGWRPRLSCSIGGGGPGFLDLEDVAEEDFWWRAVDSLFLQHFLYLSRLCHQRNVEMGNESEHQSNNCRDKHLNLKKENNKL